MIKDGMAELISFQIPHTCTFSANTRVIKQSSLQKFQEEMGAVQKDPYRVVMRPSKLPMSLLHDRVKAHVSTKGISLFFSFLCLDLFIYLMYIKQCELASVSAVTCFEEFYEL